MVHARNPVSFRPAWASCPKTKPENLEEKPKWETESCIILPRFNGSFLNTKREKNRLLPRSFLISSIVRVGNCHWYLPVDGSLVVLLTGKSVYFDLSALALIWKHKCSHARDNMMRKVRESRRMSNRWGKLPTVIERLSPFSPPPLFKLFFHLSGLQSPKALASPEEVKRFWIIVKRK